MDREIRSKIEFWLKRFEFVKWDRFIETGEAYVIYGWIDRKTDCYKDFIVIEYSKPEQTVNYWTSSSHERHNGIVDRLKASRYFQDPSDSEECRRIEHNFNVPNCVRLE